MTNKEKPIPVITSLKKMGVRGGARSYLCGKCKKAITGPCLIPNKTAHTYCSYCGYKIDWSKVFVKAEPSLIHSMYIDEVREEELK